MAHELHDVQLAHERDASWLMALWLAIHGGDPGPIEGQLVPRELQEGAALGAIEALSVALDAKTREAVHQAIGPQLRRSPTKAVDEKVEAKRLEALGIHITEYANDHAHAQSHAHARSTPDIRIQRPPYCFSYDGVIICVYPPKLPALPAGSP